LCGIALLNATVISACMNTYIPVSVYLLQVTLLEEAPFEVLLTTSDQPQKSKSAKETKVKNITFIPVPDSGKIASCIKLQSTCVHYLSNHFTFLC